MSSSTHRTGSLFPKNQYPGILSLFQYLSIFTSDCVPLLTSSVSYLWKFRKLNWAFLLLYYIIRVLNKKNIPKAFYHILMTRSLEAPCLWVSVAIRRRKRTKRAIVVTTEVNKNIQTDLILKSASNTQGEAIVYSFKLTIMV